MKRAIFTVVLFTASIFILPAQTNEMVSLQNKVVQLETSNARLTNQVRANQKAITDLTKTLNETRENLKQLQTTVDKTQASIQEVSGSFDSRIAKTEKSSAEQFSSLGKSLTNNTLYWIIAFIIVAVAVFYVYRKLRGRLSNEKASLIETFKTGNEQTRSELSSLITKHSDDLKFMVSGDIKSNNELMTARFNKGHEELRNDIKGNLKQVMDDFDKQKVDLEARIENIKEEMKKAAYKNLPKAEV
ncbi:MAG: hypothetical protein ACM3PX_05930 [Omnitrophica WOR_2 bacterium]|jgi:peptidoglycan hydrolase CwlO-like protein